MAEAVDSGKISRRQSEKGKIDRRSSSIVTTVTETHQSPQSHHQHLSEKKHNTNRASQALYTGHAIHESLIMHLKDKEPSKKPSDYRTTPEIRFKSHVAQAIIRDVLNKELSSAQYTGAAMAEETKRITNILREKVKKLNLPRYKFITWVVISEKPINSSNNNIRVASRGLWEPSSDSFASYMFENNSLHAVGNVYAVWHE